MRNTVFKTLVVGALLASMATVANSQAIGIGNTFNPATDQIGINRNTTAEGYVTSGSLASGLISSDAGNGLTTGSDGLLVTPAAITDSGDPTPDTFTSTNGTVTNAGTPDALDLDVNPASIVSSDANNVLTSGTDGNLFVPAPVAGDGLLSVSSDATLTGTGTPTDPLAVTDPLPSPVADGDVLTVSGGVWTSTAAPISSGNVADMVTDVTLSATNSLDFTGQDGAFNGSVDLSGLSYTLPKADTTALGGVELATDAEIASAASNSGGVTNNPVVITPDNMLIVPAMGAAQISGLVGSDKLWIKDSSAATMNWIDLSDLGLPVVADAGTVTPLTAGQTLTDWYTEGVPGVALPAGPVGVPGYWELSSAYDPGIGSIPPAVYPAPVVYITPVFGNVGDIVANSSGGTVYGRYIWRAN